MKTRAKELRRRIQQETGYRALFGSSSDCPPEVEESFLEHVLAFETAPRRTLHNLLTRLGIELPGPRELKDPELSQKLWQVIHALLQQSIVLGNTDHLSDRELYTLLWTETMHRLFVMCPRCTLQIDMTSSGSDNGMPVYLKYYASQAERELYSEMYPDFKMPDHEEPPARRDHLIPPVPPRSYPGRID
jgi:hypothetical protein